MKLLNKITDGRKIRAYGFSKSQVSEINIYLSEENTLSGLNKGAIIWMVKPTNSEKSIEIQEGFLKFGMFELTEKAEEAEYDVRMTAMGYNSRAIHVYEKYGLLQEYLKR